MLNLLNINFMILSLVSMLFFAFLNFQTFHYNMSINWHKDLDSCFDATPICMLSYCCPVFGPAFTQYLAHKNIPNLNSKITCCLALTCCCLGNVINRKRMRSGLGLSGYLIVECCLYISCCYSCMVLQEYQEVNWQVLNQLIPKTLY